MSPAPQKTAKFRELEVLCESERNPPGFQIAEERSNKINNMRVDDVGKSAFAVDGRTTLFTRGIHHFGLPWCRPAGEGIADLQP